MQNSDYQLPPEEDHIANFIVRMKVAYRVLTARQSITIVDNEIHVFNMDEMDAFIISSKIATDMSALLYEDIKQDAAIHKLVYTS